MRRALMSLAILAAALTGCGGNGGDEEAAAVEQTIVTSVRSEDPADCERLYTEGFLERMSAGFEGDAALRVCEEIVAEDLGEKPGETAVADVQVEGEEATAEVSLVGGTLDGQTVAFALVEENGEWKIDRMVEFVEFDRDSLLEGMKQEAREVGSSTGEAELADCMVEGVEGLEDAELQDLALYNDPDGMLGMVEACLRAVEGNRDL